ncbi:30S ribosomal protein S16 [Actinoplanes sp. CA-030573]|uniref:30S ribosomal protein S16 n=1 Tax=Actinoplanes sp. CA-030573 TaxID=3239898 RepID=UPI003D8C4FD6
MAVKIRLLRMGKIRNPQYRIVVADSRTKRDGRAIEYVGIYQPKEDPSIIQVKSERVQYWLSVGAQPSEAVQRLLEKTGDWQQFKGLPAPPPLLVAPEKKSRTELYEAEAKSAAGVADTKPATPKKSAKTESKPAAAPEAAEAKPTETRTVEAAEPNREAVAETAEDPAGAGAVQAEGTTVAGADAS